MSEDVEGIELLEQLEALRAERAQQKKDDANGIHLRAANYPIHIASFGSLHSGDSKSQADDAAGDDASVAGSDGVLLSDADAAMDSDDDADSAVVSDDEGEHGDDGDDDDDDAADMEVDATSSTSASNGRKRGRAANGAASNGAHKEDSDARPVKRLNATADASAASDGAAPMDASRSDRKDKEDDAVSVSGHSVVSFATGTSLGSKVPIASKRVRSRCMSMLFVCVILFLDLLDVCTCARCT